MFWIIIAFMTGALFGVIIMAILSAGKYDDMLNNRMD
ncbi:hypothetical protein IGK51_000564 [Enterococcus sp. DIV0098]